MERMSPMLTVCRLPAPLLTSGPERPERETGPCATFGRLSPICWATVRGHLLIAGWVRRCEAGTARCWVSKGIQGLLAFLETGVSVTIRACVAASDELRPPDVSGGRQKGPKRPPVSYWEVDRPPPTSRHVYPINALRNLADLSHVGAWGRSAGFMFSDIAKRK